MYFYYYLKSYVLLQIQIFGTVSDFIRSSAAILKTGKVLMQSDLEKMDIHDLCDMLVKKTTEFMALLEQRQEDGYKIRELKFEVEELQEIIRRKKGKNVRHTFQ